MTARLRIIGALALILTSATVRADSIRVGLIAPLTGVRADAGEYMKNAAALAVEELNADSASKYSLELTIEDSKYNGKDAVSSLQKLINLDGIKFVVGPYGSSCVLAVAPISEKSQTILIAPGAQSDEISEAGDFIFRLIHNARQEAPLFATYVAQHMRTETLHFLALQTAFTDSYLKHFSPAFEKTGKSIGKIELYEPSTSDFRPHLLKLKKEKPRAVFLVATPLHTGHILRQAAEIGLKAQFYNIGVEGPEILDVGGKYSEGLVYPYSFDPHSKDRRVQGFLSRYREKFGNVPDTVAANTYDSVILLHRCFETIGTDSSKVKDCLYRVQDYGGASGQFSITKNGDAVKDLIVKTVRNGEFRKLADLPDSTR